MRGIAGILFLLMVAAPLLAQQSEITVYPDVKSDPQDSIRNIYIKSYPDKFFIWPVIKQRTLSFDMDNPQQIGNNVRFRPNNAVGMGFGMYLFDLGLEVVFSVPVANEKESEFGKTKSLDIQLNMLSKSWGADVYYQKYQGYYLSNPDVPVPPGSPYPYRPDVTTEHFGISGIYVFNHNKFSIRSAFNFADRQLKTRGSFTLGGTFSTFRFSADSAILNSHYASRIGLVTPISAVKFQTIALAPGYSHTFVLKHFFVSLSLGIGPALQLLEYRDINNTKYELNSVNAFLDGRMAIGYSTDRFFTGVTFVNQTRTVRFENVQFSSSSSTFRILCGWRFQEFGVLKKSVWNIFKK